jgi:hypothetical protein
MKSKIQSTVAVAITLLSLAITLRSQNPDPAPDEVLLPASAAIPVVEVHKNKKYPEKYAIVYAPVSLAVGRVRTAEIPVEKKWYNIMIQLDKPLPFHDMECMLGDSPVRLEACGSIHSLLRADWTVWESGRIVQQGSTGDNTACKFSSENIFACIGSFGGEAGKKYIVQVRFTKDGSPLNVANPRLIVIKHEDIFTE